MEEDKEKKEVSSEEDSSDDSSEDSSSSSGEGEVATTQPKKFGISISIPKNFKQLSGAELIDLLSKKPILIDVKIKIKIKLYSFFFWGK